jgi:hypothetical protein
MITLIVVAALIGIVVLVGRNLGPAKPTRTREPRMAIHYHGVATLSARQVQRHEEAHRDTARKFGADGRIKAHRDGGFIFVPGAGWHRLTPTQRAAVAYAGRAAVGPGGHEEDDAAADYHLSSLPRSERKSARREAWRLAGGRGRP